ncbi:hypothetical protein [Halarchaeum nitratireducens]|uniref:Uncharacterized protein n=1 Tax=Halarchaeum nitratireducens TaxID=489913 RepID=A0A830GDC2_9EURY|nr:hypothetical protein [Halarchaeum nitratireducens]GGN18627.1 hypothetical protein GCM10009021_19550 [Halarchaeum nitratireducens]
MSDTSSTFGGWADRITHIVAEAQLVVLGVLFTAGAALFLFKPDLPNVPPVAISIFASLLLFGPPLLGFWITFVRRLRDARMVTVHHINGVTDTREKYYVAPEVWETRTVDGPSPYPVNDAGAFEVREFEYIEDVGDLRVRGCYMSQLADSKLVSVKAMLEDIHGDMIETWLAYNRLRPRISKMGLQIQGDVINKEAEADERSLMNPGSSVQERFEDAEGDAKENATDGIEDASAFVEEYYDEHSIEARDGLPQTQQQAESDT